jgi:septal ring factor EnvC (AmiA/AmiB activator)
MDLQTIINGLLASGSAIGAWLARELWSATKSQSADVHDLRRELADLKEEIAKNRVHREDFKEAIREVKEMLNRIIDKLEQKADK